ncbi:MAG: PHP domain-containing protein, partial [Casimicrobiaceae bacterium]
AAHEAGIELVNGAELSVTWEGHTIHVVALGIDPANSTLRAGLEDVRSGRDGRARRIADSLAGAGIADALGGAHAYVASEALISRTHFARFLMDTGHARDVKDAFKRFLTPGKPGYVPHTWAALPDALSWIRAAGGHAVVAHPGRYKISEADMRRLLGEFRDGGGAAIEVLSSSHAPAQSREYATLARVFGLKASCGSDYHGPGESWMEFGDLPPLPTGLTPVWSGW